MFSHGEAGVLAGPVDLTRGIPGSRYGQCTDLVGPLELVMAQLPPKALFIITDNVQDDVRCQTNPNAGRTGALGGFYQWLRSPTINRVELLPVTLNFNGNAYLPLNEYQTIDDKTLTARISNAVGTDGTVGAIKRGKEISIGYNGRKCLMVYCLLLDPAYLTEFDRILNSFSQTNDAPRILAKPFTPNMITLHGIEDPEVARQRLKTAQDYEPPTLSIYPVGEDSQYFVSGDAAQTAETHRGVGYLEFQSNFPNIGLRMVDQFGKRIDLTFGEESQWDIQGFEEVTISPELKPSAITEAQWEPGDVSAIAFKLIIELPKSKLHLRLWPLMELLKSAFRGKGCLTGDFSLTFKIPGNCIHVAQKVKDRYFATDMVQINKIWSQWDIANYLCRDGDITLSSQLLVRPKGGAR